MPASCGSRRGFVRRGFHYHVSAISRRTPKMSGAVTTERPASAPRAESLEGSSNVDASTDLTSMRFDVDTESCERQSFRLALVMPLTNFEHAERGDAGKLHQHATRIHRVQRPSMAIPAPR